MSVTKKKKGWNRNKIWWPLTFRPPVLLPSAPPSSGRAAEISWMLVGTGLPGASAGAGAGRSVWFSKGTGPASEGATDVADSYIPEFSDDDDDEESNASSSSGMSSYRVPTQSIRTNGICSTNDRRPFKSTMIVNEWNYMGSCIIIVLYAIVFFLQLDISPSDHVFHDVQPAFDWSNQHPPWIDGKPRFGGKGDVDWDKHHQELICQENIHGCILRVRLKQWIQNETEILKCPYLIICSRMRVGASG